MLKIARRGNAFGRLLQALRRLLSLPPAKPFRQQVKASSQCEGCNRCEAGSLCDDSWADFDKGQQ
jgi:hypothetical protein